MGFFFLRFAFINQKPSQLYFSDVQERERKNQTNKQAIKHTLFDREHLLKVLEITFYKKEKKVVLIIIICGCNFFCSFLHGLKHIFSK